MLQDFLSQRILQELPFEPNSEKLELSHKLADFLIDRTENTIFLLRGYAGTGKTSMISAMVKAMAKLQQTTILLAPTGRAAKVMSAYSGVAASTIHRRIYRQKAMGEPVFSLAFNKLQNALFIADEASMIADRSSEGQAFGSGSLLDDLIEYVYSNGTCRLMLVGDAAQLPPVGSEYSPALDEHMLSRYNMRVMQYTLTEVARQALSSDILTNATHLRDCLINERTSTLPQWVKTGKDFFEVDGAQMLEELERSYNEVGEEQTVVITRTNKRMNFFNQGIRSHILWKDELLSATDRVMVTRNNYFWTEALEDIDFLANGDMLTVERLRNRREMYGLEFADATLRSPDYDFEIDAMVCLSTLTTETPEAAYQIFRNLFEQIADDYPEIRSRKELVKTIMANPYYNALQIKHAYAVTCHKAQGGQWQRVFIDPGIYPDLVIDHNFYRWLYTAVTRATERVYILK
ncbi:MAG: AAA family ATPase [Paludibacteraceae bacterium]|nr:AAA family ATPase [Paludibacteraceae bacterium]